jgi:hypothetical protein
VRYIENTRRMLENNEDKKLIQTPKELEVEYQFEDDNEYYQTQ